MISPRVSRAARVNLSTVQVRRLGLGRRERARGHRRLGARRRGAAAAALHLRAAQPARAPGSGMECNAMQCNAVQGTRRSPSSAVPSQCNAMQWNKAITEQRRPSHSARPPDWRHLRARASSRPKRPRSTRCPTRRASFKSPPRNPKAVSREGRIARRRLIARRGALSPCSCARTPPSESIRGFAFPPLTFSTGDGVGEGSGLSCFPRGCCR